MKNFKLYIAFCFLALIATSCQKEINLNLNNDAGKLVIEGNLTNIPGPQTIVISQNVPFTNTNTYPPVTGATVSVSDNLGHSYPFTEGPAGTYTVSKLKGFSGYAYTMTVSTGGNTYTASSTMPASVTLDSISAQNSLFTGKGNRKQILVHYLDPVNAANQYRFIMWVNRVQVKSIFAYNDQFIDGRYVNLQLPENDIDIYPGDTVKVEMQCIDKPIYTYWYSLMQQSPDGPGGGVTPSNPPTNISPETLGYFSAHTTQSQFLIVR